MANLSDHQFAGDARIPFSFGGSGAGRFYIETSWGTDNLGAGDQQRVFKAAKACYVSNFALSASDMDTHATPTLAFDVGTQTDDDEFTANSTVGQTGDISLTNVVDESTAAGFELAAGDYVIISVKTAAATAAAGTTKLGFDVTLIEG